MRYFGSGKRGPPRVPARIAEPPGGVKASERDERAGRYTGRGAPPGPRRGRRADRSGPLRRDGDPRLRPRHPPGGGAAEGRAGGGGPRARARCRRGRGRPAPSPRRVARAAGGEGDGVRRAAPPRAAGPRRHAGRAAHLGGGRRAAGRGRGEAEGPQGPPRPGGGRPDPPGAPRRAEGGRLLPGRAAVRKKPARPDRRSRRRWPRRVLLSIAALLGLAGAVWAAWRYETRSLKIAAGAPAVRLVVPPGSSADAIARQLQGLGLVRHPLVFRTLARARGVGARLKAGEYALSGPLSLEGIVDALARGDVVRRDLTVPEGRSLDDIALLVVGEGLDLEDFLAAARDPAPVRDLDPAAADLEGYLFPDTYDVPQSPEAPRALVRQMAGRFREVISPELGRIAARGLTVRQAVTLASIVELETA